MIRNRFSRREFIGLGAAAAGASLGLKTILLDPDPLWALPQTVAASDRVRFGMIGIGMQGSGLLTNAIELPGVECVAACDLYDGRHTLAKEIVAPESAHHAALSRIAGEQGNRLHRGRRSRPLAQTGRGGRGQRGQGHLHRKAHVAHRRRRRGDGRGRKKERTHRAGGLAAREFGDLRQGQGTGGAGSARRPDAGGRVARPQRSHRSLGVSAAHRSFPADAGLGYLAGNRAQAGSSIP